MNHNRLRSCAAIVAACTPLVRRLAVARGVVDHPGVEPRYGVPTQTGAFAGIGRRVDDRRGIAAQQVENNIIQPRIQAKALVAAGVDAGAISIIPDEQEAVDAALNMGEAGDLLLVFADALVRSWKQVIKFRPEGAPPPPMWDQDGVHEIYRDWHRVLEEYDGERILVAEAVNVDTRGRPIEYGVTRFAAVRVKLVFGTGT